MIVKGLRKIQNEHGYLPDSELEKLAKEIGVPRRMIEEVSSYFPAFLLERTLDRPGKPPAVMRICRDMTCHHRGAAALLDTKTGLPAVAAKLSAETGNEVRVEGVSCIGRCDRAPAVWTEPHPAARVEGVHAWVYAGRDRNYLEARLRELADGKAPSTADTDSDYETLSNTDRRYALPVLAPGKAHHHAAHGEEHHGPLTSVNWEIDVYAREGWPRDYRAVKAFAESLTAIRRRCIPRPPRPEGKDLTPEQVEEYVKVHHPKLWDMKKSGLLGMGGAGMAAYQKWLDVWRQRSDFEEDNIEESKQPLSPVKPKLFEKYVVSNGDESEPGTFKDRELMLRTPHLLVEGIIIAGLMTGATAGYLFVRHEYPEQIHALREEIARAEALGACGPNVFGTGRAYPVEVFESPGGYICGEQSALIEAMEDRRGQPRNRPPELNSNGLRDKPTIVNNVETLSWAPAIFLRGGQAYSDSGWRVPGSEATGKAAGFSGRRVLSISGDVLRPGVYEVPIGLPFRELVEGANYCGGVIGKGGKPAKLKAIATSGPSGGLLPARLPLTRAFTEEARAKALKGLRTDNDRAIMEYFFSTYVPVGANDFDLLGVPLDLNFFRNLHTIFAFPAEPMLGAGIAVYAEGTDTLDAVVNFTEFYRNESCGKCVPCRLGSQKMVQIGGELLGNRAGGRPLTGDEAEVLNADVSELYKVLQLTSICGLGYVVPIPLATALAYFPADTQKKPAS